jgi:hypothetical protein
MPSFEVTTHCLAKLPVLALDRARFIWPEVDIATDRAISFEDAAIYRKPSTTFGLLHLPTIALFAAKDCALDHSTFILALFLSRTRVCGQSMHRRDLQLVGNVVYR